jgi:HAD superfamily hydrolase (TIGR01509 family)
MTNLEAVIYDMDGVIIDSEKLWQLGETDVFRSIGIPFAVEDAQQTMGMRTDAVVDHWLERRPWDIEEFPHAEVVRRIEHRVTEFIRARGEMLPGVRESLAFFRSLGVRVALASSSNFAIIGAVLETMELTSDFELTHSAQDEIHGKPAPDVYLSTLGLLGVAAGGVVAIEDSRNGITAAKAAGITCIGIPDSQAPDLSHFAHADAVIGSLNAIDEPLLAQLGFHVSTRTFPA